MDNHQPFYEEVGRRIRQARLRRIPRLTQQGLADLVSLNRTSITNVEKGCQKFLLHTLADIASALQVNPVSLLPDSSAESDPQLDAALRDRTKNEKRWIRSAITAAQKGKAK